MLRTTVHLVVVIDQVSTRMGRDYDTVVRDVQQSVCRFDRDRFTGEVTSDVIAVLEDADATGMADPSSNDP
jgi:hypothetical protein